MSNEERWYEDQSEKSLLYLIYKQVRFLANVVKVWLVLTILGLVVGGVSALLALVTS